MKRIVPLEAAAEQVCKANAKTPLIYQLPPEQGRQVLEDAQNTPVYMHPARVASLRVATGAWGDVALYLVTPEQLYGTPGVIYYIHGGGWVFGSFHTHQKLLRELACRTNCVVVFPEYTRSPEAKYPTAIEQCYHILCQLPRILTEAGLPFTPDTLTVAGDSAGGGMATAMTLMSKYRSGPKIHKQLLYYPVTGANFQTPSYQAFARDYYLYRAGMIWFWNQYTTSERQRKEVTAAPLCATVEQLHGLPDALLINGEADVLRSEGESYARKLRQAGVEVTAVRMQAMIHDFVMLHALDKTAACRAAMDLSTTWINRKNAGF